MMSEGSEENALQIFDVDPACADREQGPPSAQAEISPSGVCAPAQRSPVISILAGDFVEILHIFKFFWFLN